jgi:hypothetical protein
MRSPDYQTGAQSPQRVPPSGQASLLTPPSVSSARAYYAAQSSDPKHPDQLERLFESLCTGRAARTKTAARRSPQSSPRRRRQQPAAVRKERSFRHRVQNRCHRPQRKNRPSSTNVQSGGTINLSSLLEFSKPQTVITGASRSAAGALFGSFERPTIFRTSRIALRPRCRSSKVCRLREDENSPGTPKRESTSYNVT